MDYQYGSQGSYCTEHQRFGYCSECQTIVIKKLLDKLFGVITYTASISGLSLMRSKLS